MLLGPFLDSFIYVGMIDSDFDTIIRVAAATIAIIVFIIVFMDFTLLIFLIFTTRRPFSFLLSLGRAF